MDEKLCITWTRTETRIEYLNEGKKGYTCSMGWRMVKNTPGKLTYRRSWR
jgi:hypothetical protein